MGAAPQSTRATLLGAPGDENSWGRKKKAEEAACMSGSREGEMGNKALGPGKRKSVWGSRGSAQGRLRAQVEGVPCPRSRPPYRTGLAMTATVAGGVMAIIVILTAYGGQSAVLGALEVFHLILLRTL